jgi:magnesium transporter
MIVDCAVYDAGRRRDGAHDLGDAVAATREGGFAWIGLAHPTHAEFDAIKREFGLHELAVEDAVKAHQRPKLEIYGEHLFLVLRTVRSAGERLAFGEVLLFVGEGFVISVRHGEADPLGDVRAGLEAHPERLAHGEAAVLHAIVDRVVDGYAPVVASLDDAVETVEEQVFSEERVNAAERIYSLKRSAVELHRAIAPLVGPLDDLARGSLGAIPVEVRAYLRDVHDHALRAAERVDAIRDLLTGVLEANLAQVGVRQNEDMRRISAWVAILAVPTMIAGIYGMNFEHMPELRWPFGYPLVVGVMAVACGWLYRAFRKNDWL